MSLDACFQQNQGKALLVPGGGAGNEGQCVQWADTVLHDVYNLPYVYANAIDWWPLPGSLAGNFVQVTDGSIKKGDFVIFNQKVGSVYGHIDVAMNDGSVNGFTGADSNWGGNKTVHLVNHSGQAGYIIGALRPKGAETVITAAFENELARMATGYPPGKDYNSKFVGTSNWDGMMAFWQGQTVKASKEFEDALSVMATGSKPGKDYNYQFNGIPIAGGDNAVSFWWQQYLKTKGK